MPLPNGGSSSITRHGQVKHVPYETAGLFALLQTNLSISKTTEPLTTKKLFFKIFGFTLAI
jgi:hypothetical protein